MKMQNWRKVLSSLLAVGLPLAGLVPVFAQNLVPDAESVAEPLDPIFEIGIPQPNPNLAATGFIGELATPAALPLSEPLLRLPGPLGAAALQSGSLRPERTAALNGPGPIRSLMKLRVSIASPDGKAGARLERYYQDSGLFQSAALTDARGLGADAGSGLNANGGRARGLFTFPKAFRNARTNTRLEAARAAIIDPGADIRERVEAYAYVRRYVLAKPLTPEVEALLFNTPWRQSVGMAEARNLFTSDGSPRLSQMLDNLIHIQDAKEAKTIIAAVRRQALYLVLAVPALPLYVLAAGLESFYRLIDPTGPVRPIHKVIRLKTTAAVRRTMEEASRPYPKKVRAYHFRQETLSWPRTRKDAMQEYQNLHRRQLWRQEQGRDYGPLLSEEDTFEAGMAKLLQSHDLVVRGKAYNLLVHLIAAETFITKNGDLSSRAMDPRRHIRLIADSYPPEQRGAVEEALKKSLSSLVTARWNQLSSP